MKHSEGIFSINFMLQYVNEKITYIQECFFSGAFANFEKGLLTSSRLRIFCLRVTTLLPLDFY
jgi:hypothetical protein